VVPGYIHLGDLRKAIYSRVVVDLVGGVRVERWKEGRWQ
jgi:hypothetical protein